MNLRLLLGMAPLAVLAACSAVPDDDATLESEAVTARGELLLTAPPGVDVSGITALTIWQRDGAMARALPIGTPLSVPAGDTCVLLREPSGSQSVCGIRIPSKGRRTLALSRAAFTWPSTAPILNASPRVTLEGGWDQTPTFTAMPYAKERWWGAFTPVRLSPGQSATRFVLTSLEAKYEGLPAGKRSVEVPPGSDVTVDVAPTSELTCTFEIDFPAIAIPASSFTYAFLEADAALVTLRSLGGSVIDTRGRAIPVGDHVQTDGKARIRIAPRANGEAWHLMVSGQRLSLPCKRGETSRAAVRFLPVPATGDFDRYEVLEVNGSRERLLTFQLDARPAAVGGAPGTGVFVLPGRYMVRKMRNVEVLEETVIDL